MKQAHHYWTESSRPLASLVFVAPMLLCYEAGIVFLGPKALRNGADVWLRGALDRVGFGQYFLLPLLTCGLLLAWHHIRREQWRVDWSVLSGMALESVAMGLLLLSLAYVVSTLTSAQVVVDTARAGGVAWSGRLIGYFGAGIYEELLFRLMLLPVAVTLLRTAGVELRASLWWAAGITSLAFAAAHYQFDLVVFGQSLHSDYGEPFNIYTFVFRFFAGGFFSALFLLRGFGIAAGAHALYDIFVVLL